MCNRYHPGRADQFYDEFKAEPPANFPPGPLFPRSLGVFLRRARDITEFAREGVAGQWALIPPFAKSPKVNYSTNNARIESVATAASYKAAWARGQRCIIPASEFWEPNWESGRNEWWSFRRADGRLWALAGLWNAWTDRATGEMHESYTMLTMNADSHPLMRRMHKPDSQLGPDQQDKRSVVILEREDYDAWLGAPVDDALQLVRLAPVRVFEAGPAA